MIVKHVAINEKRLTTQPARRELVKTLITYRYGNTKAVERKVHFYG